jgi:hypothetical protein
MKRSTHEPSDKAGRGPSRLVVGVFAAAVVLAGAGFSWKLFEFFEDLFAETGLHFAGAHLTVYILVAAGFVLLLAYAFLSGHFSDIERPKLELLEKEREYDRAEFGRSDSGRPS